MTDDFRHRMLIWCQTWVHESPQVAAAWAMLIWGQLLVIILILVLIA